LVSRGKKCILQEIEKTNQQKDGNSRVQTGHVNDMDAAFDFSRVFSRLYQLEKILIITDFGEADFHGAQYVDSAANSSSTY
jgi:hypothetical protein